MADIRLTTGPGGFLGTARPPAGQSLPGNKDWMAAYNARTARIESSGNPNARATTSSAQGLYGITELAVQDVNQQMGKNYKHSELRGPGTEARQQEFMVDWNQLQARYLRNKGVEVTPTTMRMGHFLGAGGTRRILNAPHDARFVDHVDPDSYSANLDLFRREGIKTVGDYISLAEREMAGVGVNPAGESPLARFGGSVAHSSGSLRVQIPGAGIRTFDQGTTPRQVISQLERERTAAAEAVDRTPDQQALLEAVGDREALQWYDRSWTERAWNPVNAGLRDLGATVEGTLGTMVLDDLSAMQEIDRRLAAGESPGTIWQSYEQRHRQPSDSAQRIAAMKPTEVARYLRLSPEQRAAWRQRDAQSASRRFQSEAEHTRIAGEIPQNPHVGRAMGGPEDQTFWEGTDRFFTEVGRDPIGVLWGISGRSLPQMVPGLIAGAINPVLGMGVTGASSYISERWSEIKSTLAEEGVDMTDPVAIQQALMDPQLRRRAEARGTTKGLFVGTFDTLAFGLAGVSMAVGKSALVRQFSHFVHQLVADAAAGMAGEALGSYAATGKVNPGQVWAEGFGELITRPGDIAAMGWRRMRERGPQHLPQTPSQDIPQTPTPQSAHLPGGPAHPPGTPTAAFVQPQTADVTLAPRAAPAEPAPLVTAEQAPRWEAGAPGITPSVGRRTLAEVAPVAPPPVTAGVVQPPPVAATEAVSEPAPIVQPEAAPIEPSPLVRAAPTVEQAQLMGAEEAPLVPAEQVTALPAPIPQQQDEAPAMPPLDVAGVQQAEPETAIPAPAVEPAALMGVAAEAPRLPPPPASPLARVARAPVAPIQPAALPPPTDAAEPADEARAALEAALEQNDIEEGRREAPQVVLPEGWTLTSDDNGTTQTLIAPDGTPVERVPATLTPQAAKSVETEAAAGNRMHARFGHYLSNLPDTAPRTRPGSQTAPADAKIPEQMEAARAEVEPEPSADQKKAGNYRKGHIDWNGLDIAIENPIGSTRGGTDPNGQPWSVTMAADYGYVKRGTGADGDQVDIYMGPDPASDAVFVIDQYDPDTWEFDEHKVVIGTSTEQQAVELYDAHFNDGRGKERRGVVSRISPRQFKDWLRKPASGPYSGDQPADRSRIMPGDGSETINRGVDPTAPMLKQLRQLRGLTHENRPLIDKIARDIDRRLGRSAADSAKVSEKRISGVITKSYRPSIRKNKPWHDVAHIRDALRFQIVMDSVEDMIAAIETFRENGLEVVKADFEKTYTPLEWGWRFIAFDMRMPNGEIIEYAMPLREFAEVKSEGHRIFDRWRNKTDAERNANLDAYMADREQSQALYGGAYSAALERMGLDETAFFAALKSVENSLADGGTAQNDSNVSAGGNVPADQAPDSSRIMPTAEPDSSRNSTSARPVSRSSETTADSGISDTPSFPSNVAPDAADRQHSSPGDPTPGAVVELDPMTIEADPKRFQFKSDTDTQGVSTQLRGVKEWNPTFSGIAIVWEAEDGTRYIVDGHQRLGLAKRLTREGQKGIRLRAEVLRESDGWTDQQARRFGALKNLAEGGESTSALDVAKVLRADGSMDDVNRFIPPNRSANQDGQALARLGETGFGMVINDVVPAAYAAEVGARIDKDAQQVAALDYMAKHPPQNRAQARMIVDQIRQAGFEQAEETSLFGTEMMAETLMTERAVVLETAMARLRKMKTAFRTAISSKEALSAAGNVLDTTANQDALDANARTIDTLSRIAHRAGPVSDALTAAARSLKAGATRNQASRDFLDALQELDVPTGRGAASQTRSDPPTGPVTSPKKDLPTNELPGRRAEEPEAEPAGPVRSDAEGRNAGRVAGSEGGSRGRDVGNADAPDAAGGAPVGRLHDENRPTGADEDGSRGDRDAGSRADASEGRPERRLTGTNYEITAADKLGEGGAKTKANQNLDAIEILKKIEAEDRPATAGEQAKLVKYVGWGGMPQLFDDTNKTWARQRERARALLTADEWKDAAASTLNAHYTSTDVISAMWDAARQLGFKGGRAIEPAAGIGHFIGLEPKDLAGRTRWTAVERDSLSGRITRTLYPRAHVEVQGFETVPIADNSLDLAISNVPFGDFKLHDPRYNKQKLSIHNYFFAKSLDRVRPGGVVAFITSRYTMDGRAAEVPKLLREMGGDLLGAIRLPDNAFSKNAGTEVVTDIIFIQKREPGAEPAGKAWTDTNKVKAGDQEYFINQYFIDHPEMVIGAYSAKGSMYGSDQYTVKHGGDLTADLAAAISKLPAGVMTEPATTVDTTTDEFAYKPPSDLHIGAFYEAADGTLMQKQDVQTGTMANLPAARAEKVKGLVKIKDLVRKVLWLQRNPATESQWLDARERLNTDYDAFVKKYGPINRTKVSKSERLDGKVIETRRYPNMLDMRRDPNGTIVMGLERYDEATETAQKAAIFTDRVIPISHEVTHVDNAADGLVASLADKGRVDLDHIASLTGQSVEQVREDLKGLVFRDPATEQYEATDAYLSGNVRQKLSRAEMAAEKDKSYQANVDALKAVVPRDLKPGEIQARLGASWIPPETVAQFLGELIEDPSAKAIYLAPEAVWSISTSWQANHGEAATNTWGTGSMPAPKLVELALNQRRPQVFDYHSDGSRTLNMEETLAAQAKQQEIKERFAQWVWEDSDRAATLAADYNWKMNGLVERSYDGSHLTFPGSSSTITLRPHQKNAVWRILQGGNTLLAHGAGAGKTMVMAAAGIEGRRIGLWKKPLYVVPNHMLEQFSREIQQLYPNANILMATKENFTGDHRRRFMAQVASGDWDAVVITKSSFKQIGVAPEFERKFIQQEIDQYREMIQKVKNSRDEEGRLTVKQLEKALKRREEKLAKLSDQSKKDKPLSFEELGIDQLFVDEAHYFKNLEVPTKMSNVLGVQSAPSEQAFDLYMKGRYLDSINPGRGLVFATATPISNSMTEMYVMMKYLAPRMLEEAGLKHFDSWAATFGETVTAMEPAPTGAGYKEATRFAWFLNAPELIGMFRQFSDVLHTRDLGIPLPGVKEHAIEAPRSAALKAYNQTLLQRAEQVKGQKPEPGADNILKIATDGRKAALDMRLVGGETDPGSKIFIAADQIAEIHKRTKKQRSAQMVFIDFSSPNTQQGWSAYTGLHDLLIKRGIPAKEIAFIHDADTDTKKARLFGDVNAGKVRVLMGSTQKMGVGTNAQKKLVAMHHLDAPWRPADIEQRDGRMVRQGNENPVVEQYRYVTKGSFDAFMWGGLERKAKFIGQVMDGDVTRRIIEDEDVNELNFAQLTALASDNPLVMEKVKLEAELDQLQALEARHKRKTVETQLRIQNYPGQIEAAERNRARYREDEGRVTDLSGDKFSISIGGQTFDKRGKDAADALRRQVLMAVADAESGTDGKPVNRTIGKLGNFEITATARKGASNLEIRIANRYGFGLTTDELGAGTITRIANLQDQIANLRTKTEMSIERMKRDLEAAKSNVQEGFPKAGRLREVRDRLVQVMDELNLDKKETPPADGGVFDSRVLGMRSASRQPADFVPGPDGKIDLGMIPKAVAMVSDNRYPAAPIRLQEGAPTDFGWSHIAAGKADHIQSAGYVDEIQYVADVAANFTEVWENKAGRLILVKARDDYHDIATIELRPDRDGQFYGVTTAFPIRQSKQYPKGGGRSLLWRRGPTPPPASPGSAAFQTPDTSKPGGQARRGTAQNDSDITPTDPEFYGMRADATVQQLPNQRRRQPRATPQPVTMAVPPSFTPTTSPTPAPRMRDLVAKLAKALDITHRQGRTQPGNIGQYSTKTGVVRTKIVEEIDVFAHEAGHAFRRVFGDTLEPLQRKHKTELLAMTPTVYANKPAPVRLEEGWAEFFRAYITNPAYARKAAPTFYSEFEDWVDGQKPELLTTLREVQDGYSQWLVAPSAESIRNDMVDARELRGRRALMREIKGDGAAAVLSRLGNKAYTRQIASLNPVKVARDWLMEQRQVAGNNRDLEAADDPHILMRMAPGICN